MNIHPEFLNLDLETKDHPPPLLMCLEKLPAAAAAADFRRAASKD